MEKEVIQTERRQFLSRGILWAGLGILGASLAWIFEDLWTAARRFSSSRWIPIAPLDQFPVDGVFPFPEYKMAIVKAAGKMGAISLECTHLGCLLNVLDRGFFCPCHGSDFGPLGQVYSGPATEPLPWHEVMNRSGRIWVHLGEKLESAKWLEI